MLEKEVDGTEQAFGMLHRGSEPDFSYIFLAVDDTILAVDDTNASAHGTRVDRQNAHALL